MSEVSRQLNCTIIGPDGARVPAGTLAYTDLRVDDPALDLGIRYGGRVEEDGRFIIRFASCAPRGQGANLVVMTPGTKWEGRIVTPTGLSAEMGQEGGDSVIALVSTGAGGGSALFRKGIVRASGRCWVDDTGAFNPLGHTLFWAPRGWKFERERIKQNLQFLKNRGDYIRILGMVGWDGNEIDPTWPDYPQIIEELIQYAYHECGLRTQLTVTGGGPWDAVACTERLAPIIARHPDLFAKLEVANEAYNNGPEPAVCDEIGRILREVAPLNLVALSAPLDAWPGTAEAWMTDDNSNMVGVHFDRSYGDDGWRHVRQGWDAKGARYPCSSNEPIGPASSVAADSDPLRLVMNRATSVMCGAEDYVFHNGAGIYGYPNTPGTGVPRSANLWEMPNIDAIMAAILNVGRILPTGMGAWAAANDGWVPPNPVVPLACLDWDDHVGPVKNYAARSGSHWCQMPHGIKGHFRAKATQPIALTAYDPLSLQVVASTQLYAGEEITLPGAPNGDRQCAYIIVGKFLAGVGTLSLPEKRDR